jgi:chromosomal replication initiator protein
MKFTLSQVIEIVAKETGVSVNDIVNPTRKQEAVLARHISMWACRWNTTETLPKIAAAHNRRQHGSVIHAANNIDTLVSSRSRSYDLKIAEICNKIVNQLNIK